MLNSFAIETEAKFEHDCDNCVFLGHALGSDMYVCAVEGLIVSVIARYSSDESDYTSGVALVEQDARLGLAFGLSVKRGFVLS